MTGGAVSIGKSMVGILTFSVITSSLDLPGVFSYYQTAIRGVMLIAIIGIEALSFYADTR